MADAIKMDFDLFIFISLNGRRFRSQQPGHEISGQSPFGNDRANGK